MKRINLVNVLIFSLLILVSACDNKSKNQLVKDFFENLDQHKLEQSALTYLQKNGKSLQYSDSLQVIIKNGLFQQLKDRLANSALFLQWQEADSLAKINALTPATFQSQKVRTYLLRLYSGAWNKEPELHTDSAAVLLADMLNGFALIYHDLAEGHCNPGFSGRLTFINQRKSAGIMHYLNKGLPEDWIPKAQPNSKIYKALQLEYAALSKYYDSISDTKLTNDQINNFAADRKALKNLCYRLKIKQVLNIADSNIYKIKSANAVVLKSLHDLQSKYGQNLSDKITSDLGSVLFANKSDWKQRLAVNMERLRWYNISETENRIFVNVASNTLFAYRHDSLILQMKVCTGEARGKGFWAQMERAKKDKEGKTKMPISHETPTIQSSLTYYTINPKWTVPNNILIHEMMGIVRNSPGSLNKMGYDLQDFSGKILDVSEINWEKFNPAKPGFRLVQRPGKGNALGKVILHFNNPYSIYMHDTPNKGAFFAENRNVSHGCIRLEKPFDLMQYLSAFEKKENWLDFNLMDAGLPPKDTALLRKWKKEQKDTSIKKKFIADKSTRFTEKLPVDIAYLTAYVAENGVIVWASDPYNEDDKLYALLKK